MMTAWIDLIGMYNYDSHILDGLVYPEGLDGDVLKDNILMESAEQELIYSNVDFMKKAITSWSKKQLHVWNELYDTTQYVYNPIWNKDGTVKETITRDLATTEDWTDTHNLQDQQTFNKEDKQTLNLEDKETLNLQDKETRDLKGTNDVTETESVYGFNSSSDAPANKKVTDQDTTDTGTDTLNKTGTDTLNQTGTITNNDTGSLSRDRDTTDTGTITTERTEQGNIGVTSTQSMIKEQREVVQLNLYDVITQDFINRFCLKVY